MAPYRVQGLTMASLVRRILDRPVVRQPARQEQHVAESIEWPDPTPAPRARRWGRRTRANAPFRPAMELGFDNCDPIATCHCGARCKGDSINDALTAWSTHLSTTHRGEW